MIKKMLVLMIAAALGLAAACAEIPNDKKHRLNLSVIMPVEPEVEAAVIPPPSEFIYNLKISFTNPNETFYVFDYTVDFNGVGSPIELLVATGTRTLSIEAYEITPSAPPQNTFNSMHFTSEPVTMELLEPRSVILTMQEDFQTGSVASNGAVMISDGSTYQTYDFARACPPTTEFWADVVDLDWGGFHMFPSIPLNLQSGGTGLSSFNLSNLPQGHTFGIDVYHNLAGLYQHQQVYIDAATALVDLKLGGYHSPFIVFKPSSLSIAAGSSTVIDWEMHGGWGGVNYSETGSMDTCRGPYNSLSPGFYNLFFVPPTFMCWASVYVEDCQVSPDTAEYKIPVDISFTATDWCNNDGTCADTGMPLENPDNCPADCPVTCGDGTCAGPPWEDMLSCFSDCGF